MIVCRLETPPERGARRAPPRAGGFAGPPSYEPRARRERASRRLVSPDRLSDPERTGGDALAGIGIATTPTTPAAPRRASRRRET